MTVAPRRRRARLSREAIVDTALALSESDGLDQVSIHRVAAALGVTGMSLYGHVADKAALLDAMGDRILGEIALPALADSTWEEGLRRLGAAFRSTLMQYPRTAPLVLTRRLNASGSLPLVDAALGQLRSAGFDSREAVHAMRVLIAFFIGSLLREVGIAGSYAESSAPAELHTLPNVTTSSDELRRIDHEAEFDYGLTMLLDALRSRIAGH